MKVHEAMKLHDPDESEDDALDDLIGHALGLVETAMPLTLTEREHRIARLRSSLDMLLDDGLESREQNELLPRVDLSRRTLERIHEREALSLEFREPLKYRPRWRAADLAVAAAVLLAAFLSSVTALKDGKAVAANLACSANLAQIWKGFEQYSTVYNVYPNATAENRQLPIGATLSLILHTGHLDASVPLTCPGCSSRLSAGELPHWNQLREQSETAIHNFSALITDVYALHPGLKGQTGIKHLERSMIDAMRSMIPLVGDRPPISDRRVVNGNSPAHGGYGQNVIFADGHATFFRSRSMRSLDSDIYANRHGHCSAAIDPFDLILIPAGVNPN